MEDRLVRVVVTGYLDGTKKFRGVRDLRDGPKRHLAGINPWLENLQQRITYVTWPYGFIDPRRS